MLAQVGVCYVVYEGCSLIGGGQSTKEQKMSDQYDVVVYRGASGLSAPAERWLDAIVGADHHFVTPLPDPNPDVPPLVDQRTKTSLRGVWTQVVGDLALLVLVIDSLADDELGTIAALKAAVAKNLPVPLKATQGALVTLLQDAPSGPKGQVSPVLPIVEYDVRLSHPDDLDPNNGLPCTVTIAPKK